MIANIIRLVHSVVVVLIVRSAPGSRWWSAQEVAVAFKLSWVSCLASWLRQGLRGVSLSSIKSWSGVVSAQCPPESLSQFGANAACIKLVPGVVVLQAAVALSS